MLICLCFWLQGKGLEGVREGEQMNKWEWIWRCMLWYMCGVQRTVCRSQPSLRHIGQFSLHHVGPGTGTQVLGLGLILVLAVGCRPACWAFSLASSFLFLSTLHMLGRCSTTKLYCYPYFNCSDLSFAAAFTLIILCFPYVNNPPHTRFLSVPNYCKLIYWPNNGAIKLILNIVIQGLRLLFCSFCLQACFCIVLLSVFLL